MPAELNGDYILYHGLKTSTLHLVTAADRSLVDSKLGGFRITGSFEPETGRLTMVRNLKVTRPGHRAKYTYQGYPVTHIVGPSGAPSRFWGWAGYRTRSSNRPETPSAASLAVGWWARPLTGFAADVRPLFRDLDVNSMRGQGLDLSSYAEVSSRAWEIYAILARYLPALPMPCDFRWPDEWVALFKYWIDDGKLP